MTAPLPSSITNPGAQGVLQTSFIAVGNYPGIEIRIYGSKGAAIGRLMSENGIAETLHLAKADAVEFQQIDLPADRYPPGATVETPWPQLYYRQLVRDWTDEILDDLPADNTFFDGAKSQEIVNAISLSHKERRWVDLPLHKASDNARKCCPRGRSARRRFSRAPLPVSSGGRDIHGNQRSRRPAAAVRSGSASTGSGRTGGLAEAFASLEQPKAVGAYLDYTILSSQLKHRVRELRERSQYKDPSWYSSETAFAIISLFSHLLTSATSDKVHARLGAIPAYLDGGRAHLSGRIRSPGLGRARAQGMSRAMIRFLGGRCVCIRFGATECRRSRSGQPSALACSMLPWRSVGACRPGLRRRLSGLHLPGSPPANIGIEEAEVRASERFAELERGNRR